MEKIKLIYTGGTVGGKEELDKELLKKVILSDLKPKPFINWVLEEFPDLQKIVDFTYVTPTKKLSEDFFPTDWQLIARAVNEAINDGIDGIVIAHGTDTMTYTATALSFMLKGIKIPVVITGSNIPFEDRSSDARTNLHHALFIAGQKCFKGVFLVFSGIKEGASQIHLGTRVRKVRFSDNCYESIYQKIIGKVYFNFLGRPKYKIINKNLFEFITSTNTKSKYDYSDKLDTNTRFYKVYPGFKPDDIENNISSGKCSGLILELYNSGTGCTIGPYSIVPVIQKARERGIPVFISSQHLGSVEMDHYGTSLEIKKAGALPLKDMLTEVAIPKLMWILGHTRDIKEVQKLMLENIAGEIS